MPLDNVDIVRASYQAYVAKDRTALEALISDDLRFSSPLDNGIDRATYFERCWSNSQDVRAFEYVRMLQDGDDVIVTYIGTHKDGHRFRNTEVLTVRDGRIAVVEVYFGWDVPHKAVPGGYIDAGDAK